MVRVGAMFLFMLLGGAVAEQLSEDAVERLFAEKNRPVSKVINLLKDMVAQLEKEGEEDEEVYEKMGCWCTTNDKEKTKAIADGEGSINDLSAAVEEMAASAARLRTEVTALDGEVAKNEEALKSGSALRDQQVADFTAEEKDMVTSVNSLKAAVVALSKQNEASLLDAPDAESLIEVSSIAHRHAGLVTERQRRILASFGKNTAAGEPAAFLQVEEAQSGEIFGVLKAMKESFEINLGQSQKEEMENAAAYEGLKAAKTKEIAAGKSLSETKVQELAAVEEKHAQAEKDLAGTRETLAADIEFLSGLKGKCQNVDFDYEERTKTRQLEIQATSKALQFLSSDEAHDLFSRTFNPALTQLRSTAGLRQRAKAVAVLARASARYPRLAFLALTTKNAAFDKVKKNIKAQIEALKVEKEDEIKKKSFCISELNSNEKEKATTLRDKGDKETKVEDLKMAIDGHIQATFALKKSIVEVEEQLKAAGENREKENKEFAVTVADQRATKKLLKKALDILKGFYDKAALVQTGMHTRSQASASENGGGVMEMMQSIIDDSAKLEMEAVRAEKDAQEDYDSFVAETKASVDALTKELTTQSEAKAKAETDLVQVQQELDAVLDNHELLASEARGLHLDCDFLLENFDLRQSTRDDEIDSLGQALSMFSGPEFESFLQH